MNERTIFPNLKLFKKEITERFLIALREVFRQHPAYGYQDDESETRIHIDPTYANIFYEGKNPQMLIKVGSYQFNLNDTFNQNAYQEVENDLGVIGGFRSLKTIGTNITVMIRSFAEEESSDLADELSTLGIFSAHSMFTQVGINIRDAQVSETVEADNNNDIYETGVSFQIETPWEFMKVNGKPADGGEIEFESDDDDITNDYRQPGVYTFRGRIVKKD
ncbi:hypothetical protein [Priestia megaterium]|uniref:hypothetical protein n=1 Tax=Priestia megaterium TaxID=1404 RepID=UPI002E214D40|nr:hypothetical protein [Priestia megaterium]